MIRVRLTSIAFVCCAGPLQAQANPEARHAQLSVPAADSSWMPSGVVVDQGERIEVKATGMISVNRFWFNVDANGISRFGWGDRGSRYLEYRVGDGAAKPAGK